MFSRRNFRAIINTGCGPEVINYAHPDNFLSKLPRRLEATSYTVIRDILAKAG